MSEPCVTEPWSTERFLRWQAGESGLHELVGGFPLKLRPGATRAHDLVTVNLIGSLGKALRTTPFSTFTRRSAVEIRPGQIRRPDVGVDGGPLDLDAFVASRPVALFEVLEAEDFDSLRKVADYKAMPFLRHIVLMEQDRPLALHWSRLTGAGWDEERIEGLDAEIPLTALGITLPVRELYDRVPA